MPHSSRRGKQVIIDLHSDSDNDEANAQALESKDSQTTRRPSVKTSTCLQNDELPKKRLSMHRRTRRRDQTDQDMLDSHIFELCLEDVWACKDDGKRGDFAYFDSLWFYKYDSENGNSAILKWIKDKKIFSRKYVFVPIVRWGHWSLLILCNLGETQYMGTEKGPRMLLLDSLKATDPTRLQAPINRFIVDIYKNEGREELDQFINKVKLEFPKVPQQNNGSDCGIYVLYYMYSLLVIEELGEDLNNLDALFDPEELENIEKIRNDIDLFLKKSNTKIANILPGRLMENCESLEIQIIRAAKMKMAI